MHGIPIPAHILEVKDTARQFTACPDCMARVVNLGRHKREHCPNRQALRGRPRAAPAPTPPAPRYLCFLSKKSLNFAPVSFLVALLSPSALERLRSRRRGWGSRPLLPLPLVLPLPSRGGPCPELGRSSGWCVVQSMLCMTEDNFGPRRSTANTATTPG